MTNCRDLSSLNDSSNELVDSNVGSHGQSHGRVKCTGFALISKVGKAQKKSTPVPLVIVLHPLEIVSVAMDQLGEKIATLEQEGDRITSAMDELFKRAWA